MEKDFTPYEQALSLKELGFDESCLGYYTGDTMHFVLRPLMLRANELESYVVTAPLYQQAFRWFREKHNLDIVIQKMYRWSLNYNPKETFYTYQLFNFTLDRESEEYILEDTALAYKTHEEAELECLKKLIEIVKTKETC